MSACNRDCFNCPFDDCICDDMTYADYVEERQRTKTLLFPNAHKQQIAAYKKAYYAENKEQIAAYKKAYRAENKEQIAAYKKAYDAKNKEQIVAYKKAYDAKNKERIAAYKKAYRERKRRERSEPII